MAANDGAGPDRSSTRSHILRIAVIYDSGADTWTPEDIQAVLVSVQGISAVLAERSHEVVRIPVDGDLAWFDEVRRADLVFNLCEGMGGVSRLEYPVAMTGPDLLGPLEATKQNALGRFNLDRCGSVGPFFRRLDTPTELFHHPLHSVADAQNRNPPIE